MSASLFLCATYGTQRRGWRYSGTRGRGWMTWWCKSTAGPARGTASRGQGCASRCGIQTRSRNSYRSNGLSLFILSNKSILPQANRKWDRVKVRAIRRGIVHGNSLSQVPVSQLRSQPVWQWVRLQRSDHGESGNTGAIRCVSVATPTPNLGIAKSKHVNDLVVRRNRSVTTVIFGSKYDGVSDHVVENSTVPWVHFP